MKDLSYHILDVTNNSIRGRAKQIHVTLKESEKEDLLSIIIEDDGIGMSPELVAQLKDPFVTSRTTRKVGLGIPLLYDTCRWCDGNLLIQSQGGEGTCVKATMVRSHIDRPPLGNIGLTMTTLMSGDEGVNITFRYIWEEEVFEISTHSLRDILDDVPLHNPQVMIWLQSYINENIAGVHIL